MASSTGCLPARAVIHSSSPQVYDDSNTTDDVAGGTSVWKAIGSAFSRHSPSAPRIRNL